MKFFQSLLFTGIIWVVAGLINGIACGLYLAACCESFADGSTIPLSLTFSFVFSAPGIFIFWLIFYFKLKTGAEGQFLFRSLLNSALGCTLVSALPGGVILSGLFGLHVLVIGLFSLLATLCSVFLVRTGIIGLHQ